jgi:hypothetical protein
MAVLSASLNWAAWGGACTPHLDGREFNRKPFLYFVQRSLHRTQVKATAADLVELLEQVQVQVGAGNFLDALPVQKFHRGHDPDAVR